MRELRIEWRHYVKGGATCLRCSATGKTLEEVIEELRAELKPRDITITFTETLLTEGQIPESNMILFNDVPLESLLPGATASENLCASCACLTGTETSCRTVEYEGTTYEEIPEELIRKAAYAAIGHNQG